MNSAVTCISCGRTQKGLDRSNARDRAKACGWEVKPEGLVCWECRTFPRLSDEVRAAWSALVLNEPDMPKDLLDQIGPALNQAEVKLREYEDLFAALAAVLPKAEAQAEASVAAVSVPEQPAASDSEPVCRWCGSPGPPVMHDPGESIPVPYCPSCRAHLDVRKTCPACNKPHADCECVFVVSRPPLPEKPSPAPPSGECPYFTPIGGPACTVTHWLCRVNRTQENIESCLVRTLAAERDRPQARVAELEGQLAEANKRADEGWALAVKRGKTIQARLATAADLAEALGLTLQVIEKASEVTEDCTVWQDVDGRIVEHDDEREAAHRALEEAARLVREAQATAEGEAGHADAE